MSNISPLAGCDSGISRDFLAVNCSPWALRLKFSFIRTWIDRSKDHPLSLIVSGTPSVGNVNLLEDIIPMLLAEFAQWHDVVIRLPEIPDSLSFHLLAGVTTAPLPSLSPHRSGRRSYPSLYRRITSWPAVSTHFIVEISWNSQPFSFGQHHLGQLTNLHLK